MTRYFSSSSTTTTSKPSTSSSSASSSSTASSYNKQASDDLFAQAKEMAQIQLDQSQTLMDDSSKYRNAEYSHNAGEDRATYKSNTSDDIWKNSAATDDSIRSYATQTDQDIRKNTMAQIDNITVGRAQSENNKSEYTAKTTDDMRRDTQQFSFDKALTQINNNQARFMQDDAQAQEKDMFNLNNNADVEKTRSARQASTNLFMGRM